MEYIIYDGELAKLTQYRGYYATKSGKIISVKARGKQGLLDYTQPRELKYKVDKDGYLEVCLSNMNGCHRTKIYKRVHRLVWETYNGPILNDLTIDHINRKVDDNNLNNLRLLTREENTKIAAIGRIPWQKGKPHPRRNIFKLYIGGKFVGEFDKKTLIKEHGLTRYDVDFHEKQTTNKEQLNIRLEKV